MDDKGRVGRIRRSSNQIITTSEEEMMEVRRGPWTVDEDLALINYIATHGEGRWNTLALSAGLKRTGKSCRLRWLNYLRPDVRRGNITLEEQLLILELHSRWGNRWSKIAQYLPGRTDNEIKNYWRTRVQKHAKQLKCDVNSKQFKDTMRYLWMPRLVERIQAAAASTSVTSPTLSTTVTANNKSSYNLEAQNDGKLEINNNNYFVGAQVMQQSYNTPENSASSDSFGTQISDFTTDYNNNNNNYSVPAVSSNDNYYYQPSQISYSENCITSQSGLLMDYHNGIMEPNTPWMQSGDSCDNFWNVENMLFLQQQLMNDTSM